MRRREEFISRNAMPQDGAEGPQEPEMPPGAKGGKKGGKGRGKGGMPPGVTQEMLQNIVAEKVCFPTH